MLEKSYLKPSMEPQKINIQIWDEHIRDGYKWGLRADIPFDEDLRERDRLLICLLYCTGYDRLFSILNPESLAILKHAAQKITSTDPNFKDTLRYLEDRDKALSDHVSRMQAAEEEGMRRERISMVKKLLEEGYPIENIAKWIGMSVEQLKKLNE